MQKTIDDVTIKKLALSDTDAQPLSADTLKQAVRMKDLPGETLLAKLRAMKERPNKQSVTIRLDPDIVDYYKTKGRGWQTRMNSALRACMEAELSATA